MHILYQHIAAPIKLDEWRPECRYAVIEDPLFRIRTRYIERKQPFTLYLLVRLPKVSELPWHPVKLVGSTVQYT